ncbi:hypothetical protein [Ralstonia sp. A12]|uniref:hypothetical protein n=1 Tax=Ralstonia sp. A12 TaxID=1217052 RepID=UPI0012EE9C02|nr:hypothetical protein [Ralstonia sp. A12]
MSTQVAAHAPALDRQGRRRVQADRTTVWRNQRQPSRSGRLAHTPARHCHDRGAHRPSVNSSEGRPLLDTCSKIISNTHAINSAALFHTDELNTGIQTLLRAPKGLQRENTRTKAALRNKPQPTDAVGQLRARLQPAKTSIKQANLTELQQLGNLNNPPIGQKAQRKIERHKALLGDAFPVDDGHAQS